MEHNFTVEEVNLSGCLFFVLLVIFCKKGTLSARGIDLYILYVILEKYCIVLTFMYNSIIGNAELKNFLIKILKGVRLLWKLTLVR